MDISIYFIAGGIVLYGLVLLAFYIHGKKNKKEEEKKTIKDKRNSTKNLLESINFVSLIMKLIPVVIFIFVSINVYNTFMETVNPILQNSTVLENGTIISSQAGEVVNGSLEPIILIIFILLFGGVLIAIGKYFRGIEL